MALGLMLIKTLPSSLFVIAFGYFCLKTGSADSALMWTISRQLALFWVLFEWSYRIMKPEGIAVTHFGIDPEVCRTGRRRLVRLALPLLPIMLWAAYGMEYPLRPVDDVIGQLVVPVALVFVFAFTLPFCIEIWREKGSHRAGVSADLTDILPAGTGGAGRAGLLLHGTAPEQPLDRQSLSAAAVVYRLSYQSARPGTGGTASDLSACAGPPSETAGSA